LQRIVPSRLVAVGIPVRNLVSRVAVPLVHDALEAVGICRDFLLNSYRDLEQFASTNGDEILEQLLELRERAEDAHSDMLSAKANLTGEILRQFLEMLPDRAFSDISKSVGVDPATRTRSGNRPCGR
jgi:hypothetical protein